MKYRVCFAVVSLVSFVSPGFSQAPLLPEQIFPELQPILTAALQQSPRIIERNLDMDAIAGERMQARSGLYPSVGASFQESLTRDKREDIPDSLNTERLYYSLSASQPIFHWGDVRNRAKIGDIRQKIAHKQYAQAWVALAQEVRGTYLALVIQKNQLQSTEYAQAQTELALRLAEERLRNRVISDAEIFHPRIEVQKAVLATERMRSAFEETKRGFHLLTGTPILSDAAIPKAIDRLNISAGEADRLLAGFTGQSERSTFATEVMRRQLEVERLNLTIARTTLRPKFNVIAGISQDQQSYSTNLAAKYGVQSIYIGVSGSWNIFDGFASKGAVAASLTRVRKLEANYKRVTESLETDARRAAEQLKFSERQMLIQEQLMDSATNFLQFRKDEFGRGTISETDVAVVQAIYNRELLTTLQQRSEYLMKFSDFLALVKEDPALTNLPSQFR